MGNCKRNGYGKSVKPQALRMFSVNDLENFYNFYLNDKLNYFQGLLKKVHTKLMEIENL